MAFTEVSPVTLEFMVSENFWQGFRDGQFLKDLHYLI